MHRTRADAIERGKLSWERSHYIFDLDVREGGGNASNDDVAKKYSVDGYAFGMPPSCSISAIYLTLSIYNSVGNWTRFVK